MSSTTAFGTLITLPTEVRLRIYTYVFGEIVSNALYIRKFDADPRWRLCYNPSAQTPSILVVSKSIYTETLPILHQTARNNYPRIVIDYWAAALWARIMQPEVIETRRGFHVRDLETIRPILQTVPKLHLEIKAIGEDSYCTPLMQWIIAVLNDRQTMLQKLVVGIHTETSLNTHTQRKELQSEIARIDPSVSVVSWTLQRRRRDDAQGPPLGEPLILPVPAGLFPRIDEAGAWQALQNARTRYFVDVRIDYNEVVVDPSNQQTT